MTASPAQHGSQQQRYLQQCVASHASSGSHAEQPSGSDADDTQDEELLAAAEEDQPSNAGAVEALDDSTVTQLRQFWAGRRLSEAEVQRRIQLAQRLPRYREVTWLQKRMARWDALQPEFLNLNIDKAAFLVMSSRNFSPETCAANLRELQRLHPEVDWETAASTHKFILTSDSSTLSGKLEYLTDLIALYYASRASTSNRSGLELPDNTRLVRKAVTILSLAPATFDQKVEELHHVFPAPLVAAIICNSLTLLSHKPSTLEAKRQQLQQLLPELDIDRLLCSNPSMLARDPAEVHRSWQCLACLELPSPHYLVELVTSRPLLLTMTVTCSRWRRLRELAACREAWQKEFLGWQRCQPTVQRLGNAVIRSAEAVARLDYLLMLDVGHDKGAYTWLRMPPDRFARHHPYFQQWYAAKGRS